MNLDIYKDETIPQRREGNLAKNSFGGTELTTLELWSHLPQKYKEDWRWVISRLYDDDVNSLLPKLWWFHDLSADPCHKLLSTKDGHEKFDKLIFSSHWQMMTFVSAYNVPTEKCEVMKTAIFPHDHYEKPKNTKFNLMYCSTPQRGLHVLCNALNQLERNDWHLHVYSSYGVYGWKENDQPYKELFDHIEENENMTLYPSVIGRPLREEWKDMHIWTYPCVWEETSCRTAMEAMSSRTAMLTNNLGALPETCSDHAFMYPYVRDEIEHCYRFADELDKLMDDYWNEETQFTIDHAKKHADTYYSWEYRAPKWIEMFELMEIEDELTPDETEDGSVDTADGDNDGGVR